MADDSIPKHVIDVKRHASTETRVAPIPPPPVGGNFLLVDAVIAALPIPRTTVLSALNYGMSIWGRTAKIVTKIPSGEERNYFLKISPPGETGRLMTKAEFEALTALHAVSPTLAPQPFAWGVYKKKELETYFLLAEFREVGEQPPDPVKFTARLADLHRRSISPTGKFGFHTTTCIGPATQLTDLWEDSWEVLFRKQLAHHLAIDEAQHDVWPEFQYVSRLILDKVVPRLLRPLQSEGRSIKPCLIHGDLWDENTATDMKTGEPFIFDPGSMYAHNEYELGNWRAPRHRLSNKSYIKNYKRNYPVSEPEDEWDARNLLYSIRFNIGCAIIIPGCSQRQVVFEDMKELCRRFCPEDLLVLNGNGKGLEEDEPEEEEEEEEEPEES